jgi:hypothetical protein
VELTQLIGIQCKNGTESDAKSAVRAQQEMGLLFHWILSFIAGMSFVPTV